MNMKMRTLLSLQSLEFDGGPVSFGASAPVGADPIRKLRSSLSSQTLKEYDFRKQRYGAQCVVPIDDGVCTGCRIQLSLRTCRTAKYHIVQCEHCGRLLYNPERHKRLRIEVCEV